MNKKTKYFLIAYYIVLSLLLIANFIPVDYQIKAGGGIDEVEIGKKEPRFYQAFVNYKKSNLFSYLFSYIIPKYERVKITDNNQIPRVDSEEYRAQGKIDIELAYTMAIINAYKKAGKEIKIKENIIVYESKLKDIKVGDEVLEFNGETDFQKFESKKCNDILIKRNNKEYSYNFKANSKKHNLMLILKPSIVDDDFHHKFGKDEYGSSAGLAYAVTIYNNIVDKDLTGGKKIVLSGTLGRDGSVLPVGGIPEKLDGALNSKADIFIMSTLNKKEAEKFMKKSNKKIKIIYVDNFDETIDYLESNNG